MSAAPPQSAIDRRLARIGAALSRQSRRRGSDLIRQLGEELAPSPRRIRLAVRIGLESAVGMGLMAAMHIDTSSAPTFSSMTAVIAIGMILIAITLIPISLDRHDRRVAHPERKLAVAILEHDPHRETLREPHPVERRVDLRQTLDGRAVGLI